MNNSNFILVYSGSYRCGIIIFFFNLVKSVLAVFVKTSHTREYCMRFSDMLLNKYVFSTVAISNGFSLIWHCCLQKVVQLLAKGLSKWLVFDWKCVCRFDNKSSFDDSFNRRQLFKYEVRYLTIVVGQYLIFFNTFSI